MMNSLVNYALNRSLDKKYPSLIGEKNNDKKHFFTEFTKSWGLWKVRQSMLSLN